VTQCRVMIKWTKGKINCKPETVIELDITKNKAKPGAGIAAPERDFSHRLILH